MKLSEMTKVSQFMEMLEWDLDEHGLTITDYNKLLETVAAGIPELEDDMTQTEE